NKTHFRLGRLEANSRRQTTQPEKLLLARGNTLGVEREGNRSLLTSLDRDLLFLGNSLTVDDGLGLQGVAELLAGREFRGDQGTGSRSALGGDAIHEQLGIGGQADLDGRRRGGFFLRLG